MRLDERGNAIVVDADLAAANWRSVHMPQILERERTAEREEATARRVAAKRPEALVLLDVAMGCQVTARDLFAERDALSLLVIALTAEVRGDDRDELSKRIAERLRQVAEICGADDKRIHLAEGELASALVLLADTDEPTPNDKETP